MFSQSAAKFFLSTSQIGYERGRKVSDILVHDAGDGVLTLRKCQISA